MKKNILGCIVVIVFMIGCSVTPPDVKTVELGIEGMTCEVGCAKLIQKTLAKDEAVIADSVDFENKSAIVTYDANKISEQEILAIVEGAGKYSASLK